MESSQECCLHVHDYESGPLLKFSNTCWKTFLKYVGEWDLVDGVGSAVAKRFSSVADADAADPDQRLVYHLNCYKTFTNKGLVEQAKKRKLNAPTSDAPHSPMQQDTEKVPQKRTRLLSSSSTSFQAPRRNANVLPEECIICKKDKFIKNSVSLKRTREKLTTCELPSGNFFV